MANEIIKVNLIPGVDDPTPILHFSQYDNGRPFIIEMYNGEDPFDCDDYNVTLECRKRDNNLVILTADLIDNNQITFHSTEQLCACYGDNDSEIVIRDNNDLVIGSGNIIINVEKSPTCGGIQSETVIDNLTEQIEQITQQVIGDDYYNKTQTDALLANKANADDVYNKAQTDALLANKANADDVYNKAQTDALLANKADKATTYTKAQVDDLLFNMLPIGQASGSIASFETEIAAKLSGLETTIVSSGGGGTPVTPIPIVGYSEVNFTNEDDNHTELDSITIQLGRTIYGGRLYFENGWKCDVTHAIVDLSTLNWSVTSLTPEIQAYATGDLATLAKLPANNSTPLNAICSTRSVVSVNAIYSNNNAIAMNNGGTTFSRVDGASTPPTGTLAYELATPFTIDISSSDMLDAVAGKNNVFSDCGVTKAYYKDTIQHYIDSRA